MSQTNSGAKAITATAERVHLLLAGDGYYSVPPYQRDYSWEPEQTSKLLDDVLRAAEPDSGTYFLGAMVFVVTNEDNRRYEVLDGQQRFASLLLLLRALQGLLVDRGASASTTSQIETIVFAPDVYGNTPTGEPFAHIQLNDEDRAYFEETLEKFKPPQAQRGSHKLIRKAYEYFQEKLNEKLPTSQDELDEYWVAMRKGLASRLYVIRVEVRDAVDAQLVFEALNSAGMDLTAADLIKNHVLSAVPEQQFEQTYAHWRSVVDNVGDDLLTRYLRASWNSKFSFAREAELYKQVRERVVSSAGPGSTKTSAAAYVDDLDEESVDWVDLRNPDGASWINTYPDLRDDLNDLWALDARLVYVPLLALRDTTRSSPKDLEKAVRWFRDFYVRHTIIGGKAANEVEEDYSKWAVQLRDGKISLEQIRSSLATLCPDDSSFKSSFKDFQVKRLLTARVLLARINDSVNKDNKLSQTILSGQKIHVEHVIPQKPNDEWVAFLKAEGTEHDDVVNSIGNLTLLLGPKNIRAANKSFADKKPKYVATEAPINQYLSGLQAFGKQQVVTRAELLAEFAVDVWKRP
jgi:hypothetical protein